jgi:hypothetical protein
MKWLNGKKTIIGSTLLLASAFATQVLEGVWQMDPWGRMNEIIMTLDWIGMALTGSGLVHKGVKARNGKP